MPAGKEHYPHLFRPGKIGSLETSNRIVMAPVATNYASETGGVTPALIEFYERRAAGGVGLIIVENSCVDYPAGKGGATQLRLDDDSFIPGLSRLVDAVHHHHSRICIQINHSGPSGPAEKTMGQGPVGASDINFSPVLAPPRPLDLREIETIIEKYASAVLRAKKAGFDTVELHAGHCYLIAHFMSPFTNNRTDEYGGDFDRRLNFPVRIIRRCRELVGHDYPIMVRLSGDEFLEGGRGLEESKKVARVFEKETINAIHVTVGTHASVHPSGTCTADPVGYEQGWRVYTAEALKSVVDIPVIAVGVIREPWFAEQVLADGRADFIAIGRGLVADPDWVEKAALGDSEAIRICISCNEGCIRRRGMMDLPIKCAINAEVGRPERFRAGPVTDGPKRVLVVGGGPGGMEAARVAKMRGHDVTLWEKTGRLGGQLLLASVPDFKRKLTFLVSYLAHQMDRLGIPVELNREATLESIKAFAPDAVILATGAGPIRPAMLKADNPMLKTIDDLLRQDYCGNGSKITIMGGGVKGAELALYLAQCGEKVTIVEMMDQVATDIEPISRRDLLARLESRQVRILTGTRILSCEENGIWVENALKGVYFIKSDQAVSCLGYQSENELMTRLTDESWPVYAVGDCVKPRMILNAITEAYEAASKV